MRNKIAIILIAGALTAPTLTQAQSNQPGQGAPNSVRNQSGQGGQSNSVNRQSVRQPLSNGNNGQQGNSGQTRNSEQGGGQSGRKPRSGMTRTENGGQQQRERVNIQETLALTDEQASQLRAIHEKWQKTAKAIHSNKELSKKEKETRLKAAFKKMDAAVRELLSEEQYAKLVKLRRSNARPNQNGNEENEHRRELRQILELTEEQAEKLRAVHQYALKKIKGIIANEELSKEEKKKQIKNVKKQAHNRRMEILTEEQKEKLRKWRAHHRAQRQQQNQNGGGNSSGRPQSQQGGREQGGREQGGREQGGREQGGREQGGREQGGREQGGREQGGREQGGREQGVAKVTLYCIPSCGYCTKAANLLKSKGVEFERKNIRADNKARAEVAKKTKEAGINWRGGVPVIITGDKIIVGFNKTALNRIK